MSKRTTGVIAVAVGASLVVVQFAVAQDAAIAEHHTAAHHILLIGMARVTIEMALHGAIRRLSTPRCQQVFEEFTDHAGRALATDLAATGQSPADFLAELFFVDGDGAIQCQARHGVAAFTVPGSRVIHICARRTGHFTPNTKSEEILLIHELLHALGLGENPPASSQITNAVVKHCG